MVFSSTRVYWSTKHVNRHCVYTCRIIAVKPQCQKESTNPASSKQLAIEHNTTKIEDPVLANATMATLSTSSADITNSNSSKINGVVVSADSDKLESTQVTPTESQSELGDCSTDAAVNDNDSNKNSSESSDLVQQISENEKPNDQCLLKNTSEKIKETQSLAGSREPLASKNDSSQKSEPNMTGDCLREGNDVSVLDIAPPLSPSTQTALETLHDTSSIVFAGEDEKKWLENLPEDMEAIVVVAQGEDITDDEAIQLATEALQVAGNTEENDKNNNNNNNEEMSEAQSSCQVITSEEVEASEAKLETDIEEVISTEKCPPALELNCCMSMTMGKQTLPDNFHETSLYDVTEAQVLTEGNKEVMYLGVEHKPVEVISLNQKTLSINLKNKSKCSRLTSRTRESRSSRYSPIYGADGKIIGHKLSISDALSLKTTSPKNIKNNYHRSVENKRAKRISSKNNPIRFQTSLKSPNSSPGKSASIDNNESLADVETKGQILSSNIVMTQLSEVKCKVMNGEKWEEVLDSSHVGCCDLSAEENLRTEIKQENNADSALLADKTWSDNSLELVKNQERNKNSPPVKVYPLRQTVSRMCEQALAKRPLEAISRSCRDDRTKSLLASQSSTDPQTVTTTTACGDSVSIKKSVEDTIPLHDKIALKIKAESLAKSSPGERGPFKCPICKRLYRTKESFETHVEKCDFELSTSEEEDEEQDSLRSPRRYLGNPRYPMRSTTLIQRVAAEVEAEMNLIKKFYPRKRSHDSVSSSDTGTDSLDPAKSRNKQMRRDKPDPVDDMTTGCDKQNQLPQPEPLLGCDNNNKNNDASNKSMRCDSSCAEAPMLSSSDIPNMEKVCKLESETNNNCSNSNDARQQEVKTSNKDNDDNADFDSDATLSPVPYDNFLDQNFQSDEESNNSMLCPKTGFTIPAGTNRNNLDLLSELATKLSKPDTSNSEKGGHLIGLKSAEPKLPSDIALAKKMSVVEVPGGLYKQKFEVINGKIGKVCSAKQSASIGGDLGVLPNHTDGSSEPLARHCNSLDKPNVPISKGDISASKLPEGASTRSPSENQNKSSHQGLFERIFHSIDATNIVSNSLLNVLENPLTATSNISTVSPLRNIDSESNSKLNSAPKDSVINAGRETSQKCMQKINNCCVTKPVSGVNKDPKLPVIHTSSVPQSSPSLTSSMSPSLSQSSTSLGIMNSHHTHEAGSNNQAVPVKSVEAKPSQPPLFVRPSTMASQVLTTPVVSMALCNTVCSLTSQTTCMVAPTQQLGVPMQSASPHVLGLTTPNGPIFQSPALPPLAAPTAFTPAAVTPITLAQPSKSQPSQPQPTLNINYVGSFVLPTPADQLVTISRSIASIPLSSIATSVPHLQAASSLGSVVTTAKLQSPTVAVPPQQNSVLLPDGSIQTIHKAPVPTMQTPNSIVKILVDNSSTQFVASANIDTSPQPQGSIYNYRKLLQELFKANQTPTLTNQTANQAVFSSPAVNSSPLTNETKILSPVKCTTTTSSSTNSDPSGPSSVVSSCVPMRKMTSHVSCSKPNFKAPGILRQQNQEDTKQLMNSCEVSQILSGVQEGNEFVKSVVDLTSRQDSQITNGKTYMPPVKKIRPNLLHKQQSDVMQPTKQIMSYLSNKNGLTTDYQKNSCPLEVSPQKITNPLEINQKSNNQTVLINTANQLSTPSQEPHRQVIHNVKAVCKPSMPRSRRKTKPLVRHSRLELKGMFFISGFFKNKTKK